MKKKKKNLNFFQFFKPQVGCSTWCLLCFVFPHNPTLLWLVLKDRPFKVAHKKGPKSSFEVHQTIRRTVACSPVKCCESHLTAVADFAVLGILSSHIDDFVEKMLNTFHFRFLLKLKLTDEVYIIRNNCKKCFYPFKKILIVLLFVVSFFLSSQTF